MTADRDGATQDGLRAAEEGQRRSQALIDAAITTLPVTFTTFDRDLRFTSVAGGLGVAGTRAEDFLGKHISEVFDDADILRAMEAALAGEESTTRTVVRGKTYLTLHAPLNDGDGAIIGAIAVSTNISAEVSADVERLRVQEARLFVARHDSLTGLLGRSALVEHLNELAVSGQSAGALLLIDLDDFNLINDSLGHEVGDAVLLEVASRVSDTFPGLVIARHGGDKFAVLAPAVVDMSTAAEAAARIGVALDADVEFAGHALRITASIGLAFEHAGGPSSSSLIREADLALSHAKRSGTGQFRVYDSDMSRQVRDRLGIQDALRVAIAAGQLSLAYQPIVRLADRRILGCEALLRWNHAERGQIQPVEFIPIAEKSGLIVPIGRWVMETACTDVVPLHRDFAMCVSVNVSVRQLIGGGLPEWVDEILDATRLPASALIVEVTEGALMDDLDVIRSAFERLRARGVRVAIDDFGTGFSSLARLQRIPVDVIKLDRAFVTDVDVRPEARGMAAAILQLGRAIGASMVAEGVETEAEAATLLDLGYTTAQGFLFAQPMSIAALTSRIGADVRPDGTQGRWHGGDA